MIAAIDYNVCLNRNGYVNRFGERQVVVEIYQQGQRRVINTHIHVRQEDFSMGRVQQSHPDHDLLNRKIRRIVRGLMELEDEALDAGLEPSPESLADAYLHRQTRSATISEWVEAVVTPSARRQVTKDGYRTLVNSLNSFHPGLRMGDITHDIIMRWQHWMRSERRLSENTIAVRLKALRCLVNEAVKRKVIRADNDPFLQIRIPEIKARREHLTEEELKAMETVTLTDKRQKHLRDAFLFCCYTGLRWGDFHRLTSNNLHQHTLSFEQHKTGGHVELPLDVLWTGKALDLIRRYGSLEALVDIGDNKKCNHDLRDIAEKAGIKRHLHWHLSRHTCATLLNQDGLNMQEIQFILGHSKLATTEKHYAETLYQQVRQALTKAF